MLGEVKQRLWGTELMDFVGKMAVDGKVAEIENPDDLERCLSLVRFNQFFNFYCSSGVVCNLMSESKCSVCGGKNARSNK